MICPNCQKDIAAGSRFCYNCGAKQPETAAPTQAYDRKRLMRSSTDKMIAGVCAGLADYFDLDPTIIRVIWVLAFFCAGTGLLVYIILWIVLPLAPSGVIPTSATSSS
jgi:phage shock protein C